MALRYNTNKITRELAAVIEQAKASGAADEIIKSLDSVHEMMVKKDEFTMLATTDHSATCEKIQTQTFDHDWKAEHDQGRTPVSFKPIMLCGRAEGQFLKSLVSIQKAKRVLEVGMFTGYSALSMAEALPADGEVVTLDICDHLKTLVQDWNKESPHAKKIRIEIGPGLDSMANLADKGEKFDMMFFDGKKEDYIPLIEMAFDRDLLSANGTVLVDNAFIHGAAYISAQNNDLAHRIVEAVKSRPALHSVMVPINDGVLMIRRKKDVEGESA